MLRFVFRKMINKKWMLLSLLIGNVLLIAVAAANPMYSRAILQRTLTRQLGVYLEENNRDPGKVTIKNSYNFTVNRTNEKLQHVEEMQQQLNEELGVAHSAREVSFSVDNIRAVSTMQLEGEEAKRVKLVGYTGVEDRIEIIHGEMFSDQVKDNVISVVVSERTFMESNLVLGEELELTSVLDENDRPYRIRIVGIFEALDEQDSFWDIAPSHWSASCLMDAEIFRNIVYAAPKPAGNVNVVWHTILDYQKIQADQVEEMLKTVEKYRLICKESKIKELNASFEDTLKDFMPQAQKLNTTITVLQIPILVLLAAFIFMVSRQMLDMEQNEIAVFQSRGASKFQIVKIYIWQSVLTAGISLVIGVPFGAFICRVLGASNSFLGFVKRSALPVSMDTKVWIYAFAAAFFSIGTMVLPVIKFANLTIVAHKRSKNRKKKQAFWKICFLDVILLGVSLYGFYQFKGKEDYLAEQVLEGASLDPILYLCSSLFMLGAGLLILRLLPWVIQVVFRLGKRWWSPSAYASFLRVIRSDHNQGFIVVFLVLTVAMGIFSTQTARTINANAEERIRYNIGADLVVQEEWMNNAAEISDDKTGLAQLEYVEPSFGPYTENKEIEKATKVLVEKKGAVFVNGGKVSQVQIMGIHTKEFGEVAWYKDSLLSSHWYEYLNALSKNAGNVILSSNFRDHYGYKAGDVISYQNSAGKTIRGVVSGFVDYWPSYAPTTRVKGSDGLEKQVDNYLIVAHLSQLQASWGVTPYQVWIKTAGSSRFLYDYAQKTGTRYLVFKDTEAEVVNMKNEPVFQGTNGILTIGFIIVLLLCAAGFLIYWILSIQSRTLQFGIFRAMGMSGREVLGMLAIEQLFISGTSICGGVLTGRIASKLFVPLIQIAYSSADRVLPLEIISENSDFVRLGLVIGLMIVLCMAVLGVLISKIKITQALKLGED